MPVAGLFCRVGFPVAIGLACATQAAARSADQVFQGTIETTRNIATILKEQIGDSEAVIIDCLTLLVSNLIGDGIDYPQAEKKVTAEIKEMITVMDTTRVNFIIVSNEVGLGLVPDNKLGRIYRDLLGKVNQLIVQHANQVYIMAAGIALKIKDSSISKKELF